MDISALEFNSLCERSLYFEALNRFNPQQASGGTKYITYPNVPEFTGEEYFSAITYLAGRSGVCLVIIDNHILIKLGVYLQCEDLALYVISQIKEIHQIPNILILFCELYGEN